MHASRRKARRRRSSLAHALLLGGPDPRSRPMGHAPFLKNDAPSLPLGLADSHFVTAAPRGQKGAQFTSPRLRGEGCRRQQACAAGEGEGASPEEAQRRRRAPLSAPPPHPRFASLRSFGRRPNPLPASGERRIRRAAGSKTLPRDGPMDRTKAYYNAGPPRFFFRNATVRAPGRVGRLLVVAGRIGVVVEGVVGALVDVDLVRLAGLP